MASIPPPSGLMLRAERIMREVFLPAGERSVSFVETIGTLAGRERAATPERRAWAEAWHALARAGFICPDPDVPYPARWWFVTAVGARATQRDFQVEFAGRLPRV